MGLELLGCKPKEIIGTPNVTKPISNKEKSANRDTAGAEGEIDLKSNEVVVEKVTELRVRNVSSPRTT